MGIAFSIGMICGRLIIWIPGYLIAASNTDILFEGYFGSSREEPSHYLLMKEYNGRNKQLFGKLLAKAGRGETRGKKKP